MIVQINFGDGKMAGAVFVNNKRGPMKKLYKDLPFMTN